MKTETYNCDKCKESITEKTRYIITVAKYMPNEPFENSPYLPYYPFGRNIELCENCYKKLNLQKGE